MDANLICYLSAPGQSKSQKGKRARGNYMLLCRKAYNLLTLHNSTYSTTHSETLHCVSSTLTMQQK